MGQYLRIVSLAAVAMIMMLGAACGGSDDSVSADAPAAPTATAVPATPSPAPTAAAVLMDNPGDGDTGGMDLPFGPDPVTQGEAIFQRTAGGVGCQYCHGTDAAGDIGPTLLGRGAGDIVGALDRVEMMGFIYLEPTEIQAVAAYLATLSPPGADQ